jgi:hypothetical protein
MLGTVEPASPAVVGSDPRTATNPAERERLGTDGTGEHFPGGPGWNCFAIGGDGGPGGNGGDGFAYGGDGGSAELSSAKVAAPVPPRLR